MERRIERPIAPGELARLAKLSLRQLERLFAHHLGTTIHLRYLEIRLTHARGLLRQSTMAIGDVALATGSPRRCISPPAMGGSSVSRRARSGRNAIVLLRAVNASLPREVGYAVIRLTPSKQSSKTE